MALQVNEIFLECISDLNHLRGERQVFRFRGSAAPIAHPDSIQVARVPHISPFLISNLHKNSDYCKNLNSKVEHKQKTLKSQQKNEESTKNTRNRKGQ